jgi:hypothetical protein
LLTIKAARACARATVGADHHLWSYMMTKRILGCVALGAWLMAGVALQAHHSLAGVSDKNADGTSTDWVFTLGSATALAARGVGRTGPNALHAGDMIKVQFIPARSGAPLGFLKSVTMPDGRVVQISAGNAND